MKPDILEIIENITPRPEIERTFFEKIKIAERETIMANMLAYFFDPREDHGFGFLFLKSLLLSSCNRLNEQSVAKLYSVPEQLNVANVLLEDVTDKGNRIDILIETDHHVFMIEFKINHVLDNPLGDYMEHVQKYYPGKTHCYFILGPNWKRPEKLYSESLNEIFRQVSLNPFIEEVEKNRLREFADGNESNPNFPYYQALIKTIQNRRHTMNMIQDYLDLVSKKNAEPNVEMAARISKVFTELNSIKVDMENKMIRLNEQLKDNYKPLSFSKGHLGSVIYKQISPTTSIKVRLTLNGWRIERWDNKGVKGQSEKSEISVWYPYNATSLEMANRVKEFTGKYQAIETQAMN